jgi:hypothetical protein
VSWPTVQRAVVARGAVELVEPEPMSVLGMDETRFGRPRWLPDGHHEDGRIRWQRTDPWETGFVDIAGEQSLVGQVDGRTSDAVQAWLAARTPQFRAGVEVVVIDPMPVTQPRSARRCPTRPYPAPTRCTRRWGASDQQHSIGVAGPARIGDPPQVGVVAELVDLPRRHSRSQRRSCV